MCDPSGNATSLHVLDVLKVQQVTFHRLEKLLEILGHTLQVKELVERAFQAKREESLTLSPGSPEASASE